MEFQTAIYTTLLHSLWMGLILALLTSMIIVATKKRTAALRYNLLTAVLCLFVLSIGTVFCLELSAGKSTATAEITTNTVLINNDTPIAPVTAVTENRFISGLKGMIGFWSHYANQIVLIWFLIICAKSVQLMAGLHSIYYLKKTSVIRAGSFWENKVTELATKLEITKHIRILHSGLAKVPMIVGHFKPVILVPLGMLNGLSPKEVEAILSHELAHLKRNDYLVNLLQSLVEIIFFFNPGVLWLSGLIKEERENCCDDLALSCTENKHQYIKALISCQEFKANQTAYAMAITGRKNSLKERVGRLVFNSNSSLNRVEKVTLALVLVSSLVLTAAFSSISQSAPSVKTQPMPASADYMQFSQDTTKKPVTKKTTIKKVEQHKADTIKTESAETKTLHQSLDKKISDAAKAEIDAARYKAKAQELDAEARKYDEQAKESEANNPPTPPTPPMPPTPPTPLTSLAPPAALTPLTSITSNTSPTVTLPIPMKSLNNQSQVSYSYITEAQKPDMTKDLIKDGLLKDTKNFSYKLNNKELIINGIKQSDSVHQKYAEKYLKNKKSTITTTVSSD